MKRNSVIDDFYMRCYRIVSRKIELDENYFNIAKKRLEEAKQVSFFNT